MEKGLNMGKEPLHVYILKLNETNESVAYNYYEDAMVDVLMNHPTADFKDWVDTKEETYLQITLDNEVIGKIIETL